MKDAPRYRPTSRDAASFCFLAFAALCLLSRDPGRLLRAQLWAEDGLWYSDAYMHGWIALVQPHTGYLQTFPRLVSFAAVWRPATQVPTIFASAGLIAQLVPVALMLSSRGAVLVPSQLARALLIAFYVGIPNSAETFINLTDAQWHLAIMIFLLVVLPLPVSRAGRVAQALALIVGCLSGPFSILLTPFAWWEARTDSNRIARVVQALLVTITAVVQYRIILAQAHGHRSSAPLGGDLAVLARITISQIFLGGMVGIRWISHLAQLQAWRNNLLFEILQFFSLLLIALAFFRGPDLYRKFLLFAALVIAVSLASPVASGTMPQWQALEVPGSGSRYYLLPILAWFATILVLASDRVSLIKWPSRLALLLFTVGIVADWRYPSLPPTRYQEAAKKFDCAPAGTVVIFPEDPDPTIWIFSLTKQ